MNPIAYSFGGFDLYWSALLIALAAAMCFTLTGALFTAHRGSGTAVWLLLPLASLLSVLLSRLLHWYCHVEQYSSFWQAMTDYSSGGYVLTGAFLGTALAVLLVGLLGFTGHVGRLFDCLAPGAALGIALIRLSALFDDSCRGKMLVKTPALQHLPLAAPVTTVDGGTEFRFATFFVEFLVLLVIFLLLLRFFHERRRWPMKADQPRGGRGRLHPLRLELHAHQRLRQSRAGRLRRNAAGRADHLHGALRARQRPPRAPLAAVARLLAERGRRGRAGIPRAAPRQLVSLLLPGHEPVLAGRRAVDLGDVQGRLRPAQKAERRVDKPCFFDIFA